MKKLVALTGKTGAGKSTVGDFLKEKGAYVIDGDIVAREVLDANPSLLPQLCDTFGDILNPDGTLNRKKLAAAAFSTPENTEKLNSIMHPAINESIRGKVKKAFETYDVAVVDAAAVIECGFAAECDMTVTVHAPEEVRKSRIMARDGISQEDALVRINGQKDDSFYLDKADFVVNNYNGFDISQQLADLEKEIFR